MQTANLLMRKISDRTIKKVLDYNSSNNFSKKVRYTVLPTGGQYYTILLIRTFLLDLGITSTFEPLKTRGLKTTWHVEESKDRFESKF